MTMFEYENGAELHAAKVAANELQLPYVDDQSGYILVETDLPVEIYAIQSSIDGALIEA